MTGGLPEDPGTELRFYWSPTARRVFYAFVAFAAVVVALGFAADRHRVDTTGWIVFGACVAGALFFVLSVRAAGVRETPTALTWRNGFRGGRTFSGQVAWTDVRGFGYAARSITETVVVTLADGGSRVVWPGRRMMRWHGGETSDFAQLMTERARKFGATIVAAPPEQPPQHKDGVAETGRPTT